MGRRLVLLFIGLLKGTTPTRAFSFSNKKSEYPRQYPLHYRTQQRMANVNANVTEMFGGTHSWVIVDESSLSPSIESTFPFDGKVQPDDATILDSYWLPRIVLSLVPLLYGKIHNIIISRNSRIVDIFRYISDISRLYIGTNFALGSIMNDALPASAATSNRMVCASITLLPFLLQLKPSLRYQVLLGGVFVSLGYVSQSIALIDTSPAMVSFLGSTTVLVCPLLQLIVDKKPIQRQTWLAAVLCLSGVATLELMGSSDTLSLSDNLAQLGMGDALSLLQAIGFGTGIYMSEKMMKQEPDQALQITAGMVSVTAFCAMVWSLMDGWMDQPNWQSFGLPGLLLDPEMRTIAMAVVWTGVVSTSVNFCVEVKALGQVPSSEASVLLATEPLWASVFAAAFCHERFGTNDFIGGTLMIAACLVNTVPFPELAKNEKEGGR